MGLWRRISIRRDHRWAESRLSEYLDGELRPAEQRRLGAHERLCPDCARVLRKLRSTIAALGRQPAPFETPPADAVAESVLDRIRGGRPEEPGTTSRPG